MKTLQELGLSYYESKSLHELLKESSTYKDLSRRAGIPPGKVYSVVRALKEKGLASETAARPKQVYVPDAQSVLALLIEQKRNKDEALFAEVRHLASGLAASTSKPPRFFQLGTTLEDNKTIQSRTFNEAEHEVCQILNIHHKPQSNRRAKAQWETEISDAIKRGVLFRCIYPAAAKLPLSLERLPKSQFQVRRLDTDFTRCDIIDKRKALIKLVHEDAIAYGGVIFLENEKFARNLQHVFEQLWEEAGMP
ncbi:hypothetical protein HY642_03480 [Candidatus Woesearchaeota archaeon]|nr:hypothetical protein [Candidatus Woesearchaeota archaeon]